MTLWLRGARRRDDGRVRGVAVAIAVGLGLVASRVASASSTASCCSPSTRGRVPTLRSAVRRTRSGWLLILVAWGFGLGSAGTYSQPDAFEAAGTTRLQLVFWASSTAWTLVFVGLLAITLTYPGGRLADGRRGRLARAALACRPVLALLIMSSPTLTVTTSAVMPSRTRSRSCQSSRCGESSRPPTSSTGRCW